MAWALTHKVVVITGAAEGIGYDIADKYLQKGAKTIIILDNNETLGIEAEKKLTTKYGKGKALFLKCDVTTDIDTVFEQIFRSFTVDILINSAGIPNESTPKKTIDVNLTSVIVCSLKLWEYMRKDKGGSGGTIINISSILGIMTFPYFPVYQSSKHGVVAFTKSLGHLSNYEWSGVRVVAISPGVTETNFIMKADAFNDRNVMLVNSLPVQKVDAVGNAAVEVYQRAKSGTVWKIEAGTPLVEVTKE